MRSTRDDAPAALERLASLWQKEQATVRQAHRLAREQLELPERVERGLALSGLELEETDAAVGGRALLWVKTEDGVTLEDVQVGVGDPVLLWAGSPDGERTTRGIVSRVGLRRLAIVVEPDYGEFLEEGAFNLDREAPETTFARGVAAIARLREAPRGSRLEALRELVFGERVPTPAAPHTEPLVFFDAALDATQRLAVTLATRAPELALVHGPPGTGKTRTLVEVVRQALARGERVLVSAASNAAVDNLGERLATAGVAVVRLGHPARVSQALEARTLDALVEGSEARKLARRWLLEATELRTRVNRRRARGKLDWQEGRQMLKQARELSRDARKTLDAEQRSQLARARVVCATASSVDGAVLADTLFDLVVLDEATQAVDPIALAALQRAKRAVLAGDPQQLPPTVIDQEAARQGLSSTLFERLGARFGASALVMLETQYRMHERLMRFPSQSLYDGRLRAAEQVAARSLVQLPGVQDDPLRPGPWHFIDCAGKGFSERRDDDDPSTCNEGFAERTTAEVRRVLSRGLPPSELAVITPYRAQVRLLRERLRDAVEAGLEIGSVDGFQGREKEVVVVDLVRCNEDAELGFLADIRRTNVAITRARSLLLVIGDGATLAAHPYYQAFMDAAQADGAHLSAWADDAEPL